MFGFSFLFCSLLVFWSRDRLFACVGLAFVVGAFSCTDAPTTTDVPQADCVTDAQCDPWEVCIINICQLAASRCVTSNDCILDGYVCVNSQCQQQPECQSDTDCDAALMCVNQSCKPIGVCVTDADCTESGTESGAVCTAGACIREATPPPSPPPSPQPAPSPSPDPQPTPSPTPSPTPEPEPPPLVDAGIVPNDAGAPTPVDAGIAPNDAGTPNPDPAPNGPVAPGLYQYTAAPIGNLHNVARVAFHPGGDYALLLESYDVVHVYDANTGAVTTFDLGPGGGSYRYFEDVAFDQSGTRAVLTGYDTSSGGFMLTFDDAIYRAGGDASTVFTAVAAVPASASVAAIKWGWQGLFAVLFRNQSGQNTSAVLRTFDPVTGDFTLMGAQATSAGCGDIAFVNNRFGEPGIVVVCGINGHDAWYYTEVAGVAEMKLDLGNSNLGNTSRVAAHPSGDYALVVSWSGSAIYRFEGEQFGGYSDAVRFSTRRQWGAAFSQNGLRALVFGSYMDVSGSAPFAAVLEYRHDLFSQNEVHDVSIPNWDAPPFSTTSSTNLNDAAWRPGCDGGLLVGGKVQSGTGVVVRFQVEGAVPCW